MNMDDSSPRREEMLVMKVGNGITAENVGTIITVMFIESCYEEVENKLTLQQGKNSTYFLLGELRDGFTYEMMASSIGRWAGRRRPRLQRPRGGHPHRRMYLW